MYESTFWLIALIVFVIGEAVTAGLNVIWFAMGALGALLACVFGAQLWLQILVFIVVSGSTLVLVRPVAARFLKTTRARTNADRVIGMTVLVTEEIDNLQATGAVNIAGQVWTARSAHDVVIPVAAQVKVLRIEGVKVFVERIS
jgi:membrane protein implicated in regulation of membrane protease activity